MQERGDPGLEGYRKGRIWDWRDTGKEGLGSGGIGVWRDSELEEYRK